MILSGLSKINWCNDSKNPSEVALHYLGMYFDPEAKINKLISSCKLYTTINTFKLVAIKSRLWNKDRIQDVFKYHPIGMYFWIAVWHMKSKRCNYVALRSIHGYLLIVLQSN